MDQEHNAPEIAEHTCDHEHVCEIEDPNWPDDEPDDQQFARMRTWHLDAILTAITADLEEGTGLDDIFDFSLTAPPEAVFGLLMEISELFATLHDLIEEDCITGLAADVIEHAKGHLLAQLSGINGLEFPELDASGGMEEAA
jgi:hypothetical protein